MRYIRIYIIIIYNYYIDKMINFNQGRFSSVSSSSSAAGGRQTLNELEGRMKLGIELGEEVEEEAHPSPAYRSESSTEL